MHYIKRLSGFAINQIGVSTNVSAEEGAFELSAHHLGTLDLPD